jgi:hypothetical protein
VAGWHEHPRVSWLVPDASVPPPALWCSRGPSGYDTIERIKLQVEATDARLAALRRQLQAAKHVSS